MMNFDSMDFDSIRAVFLDLDDTLLEYRASLRSAVRALHRHEICMELVEGIEPDRFHSWFAEISGEFWNRYSIGEISAGQLRLGRMIALAERCRGDRDIPLPDPAETGRIYMDGLIASSIPIAGAVELLNILRERYSVGYITNGFVDVQRARLAVAGLEGAFAYEIFSETIGAPKPDPAIFRAALESAGSSPETTLYIGDNFRCDIVGALNAGLHAIWINPDRAEIPAEYSHLQPDGIVVSVAELIPAFRRSSRSFQSTTASSVHDNLAP